MVGLGVVLIYGGIQTIDGAMTLGEFVAFYLYLTLLMVPFRSLGLLVAQAQRAIAGGTRIFEVLDAAPDVARRAGRRARCRPATGRSGSWTSPSPTTRTARRCSTASTSTSRPGARSP